jgi:hypothetical protein
MLYGRLGEQERVRALLEAARDRRSGALLVVGEPGAGKSALLERREQKLATWPRSKPVGSSRSRGCRTPRFRRRASGDFVCLAVIEWISASVNGDAGLFALARPRSSAGKGE